MRKIRTCPVCDKTYDGYPAISRKDDKTYICPACGVKEAIRGIRRVENGGESNYQK